MAKVRSDKGKRKHYYCIIEGCNGKGMLDKHGEEIFVKGYCNTHYNKLKNYGDPLKETIYRKDYTCCSIEGCNGRGTFRPNGREEFVRGLCKAHYHRFLKFGEVTPYKIARKGNNNLKHPLYRIWVGMRNRIYNKKSHLYHYYGGRGIKVCDRWEGSEGFMNFVSDIGERPTLKHTLDRINSDGDYTPENCRWSTSHVQAANKRGINKQVGVTWHKNNDAWVARIMVNNISHPLGSYKKYEDAVNARKKAEEKFGI